MPEPEITELKDIEEFLKTLPEREYRALERFVSLPMDLTDARTDLEGVRREAREDGFPEPTSKCISTARCLLQKAYEALPQRFEVYPMPTGEVAVDSSNRRGSSVVFFCEAEGTILCSINVRGFGSSRRYSSLKELSPEYLRSILRMVADEIRTLQTKET